MRPFLHPAQIFTCKTTYLVNSTSFSKQQPLKAFLNSSAFQDIALQRPLFFYSSYLLKAHFTEPAYKAQADSDLHLPFLLQSPIADAGI